MVTWDNNIGQPNATHLKRSDIVIYNNMNQINATLLRHGNIK